MLRRTKEDTQIYMLASIRDKLLLRTFKTV
jgi:hypothetical protein